MKSLALALLLASSIASAATWALVGVSVRVVGATTMWVCTYQYGADRIDQLIPQSSGSCPATIQM